MQKEWLDDERPDIRPFQGSLPWPLMAIALAVAGAAAYVYYEAYNSVPAPEPRPEPTLAAPALPAEKKPAAAIYEAPRPEAPVSLPSLDNSDALMREKLVQLMGIEHFARFVIPASLVRRIVATVDNLPRETAPRRMIPLEPVPGPFEPTNFARYTPYVRVLEAIDERALVQDYARAYPLFQKAYEELGFTGKHFNLRLIAAIDDLLATPEIDRPLEFIRPRIRYEFADPDLETRSAGQKMMLRMGSENASRVKAKLERIRREIVAASSPR